MNPQPKVLRFLRRSWDTVTVATTVAVLFAMSLPLGRTAGWIPRIVLAITFVLVVLQLVIEYREIGPAHAGSRPVRLRPMRPTGPIVVVLWIAGLMLAVLLLGTIVGSVAFCLAYQRWHAHESWRTSLVIAAALGLFVQLIFGQLLHAQLQAGWLRTLL